jgi:TnpA family transposase
VTSVQQERAAALAAYRSACAEYDEASEQWDQFLEPTGSADTDQLAAEAAFDRLKRANDARQDALDTLWVAWRNRPEAD